MGERGKSDKRDRQLGVNLKSAREAAKLSLSFVADKAGVSAQQLFKYESGQDRIRASMLERLAKLYKIAPGALFT